eukprot:363067-Chlamydomonas_euryale.AAC.1
MQMWSCRLWRAALHVSSEPTRDRSHSPHPTPYEQDTRVADAGLQLLACGLPRLSCLRLSRLWGITAGRGTRSLAAAAQTHGLRLSRLDMSELT